MIAALHPCSFVDFPGRVSAVVFTRGCDLWCTYCQNPSLRGPGDTLPPAQVLAAVATRRHLLGGVVICGGEPTLWDGLSEFLQRLRVLGLPIKLDTHGLHTGVVAHLLDRGLVDYLAVDIKAPPGQASQDLCGHARQADHAIQTLALAVRHGLPHQARTTVVDGIHDEARLLECVERLRDAGVSGYRLQPVRSAFLKPPPRALLRAVLGQGQAMGLEMEIAADGQPGK